jgi:hypothetical protein
MQLSARPAGAPSGAGGTWGRCGGCGGSRGRTTVRVVLHVRHRGRGLPREQSLAMLDGGGVLSGIPRRRAAPTMPRKAPSCPAAALQPHGHTVWAGSKSEWASAQVESQTMYGVTSRLYFTRGTRMPRVKPEQARHAKPDRGSQTNAPMARGSPHVSIGRQQRHLSLGQKRAPTSSLTSGSPQ